MLTCRLFFGVRGAFNFHMRHHKFQLFTIVVPQGQYVSLFHQEIVTVLRVRSDETFRELFFRNVIATFPRLQAVEGIFQGRKRDRLDDRWLLRIQQDQVSRSFFRVVGRCQGYHLDLVVLTNPEINGHVLRHSARQLFALGDLDDSVSGATATANNNNDTVRLEL
jgi:hypothetical protein